MKKNIASYHLNRDQSARKALFGNLMINLVDHEEIVTTSAKARAVRGLFEKLLTRATKASLSARRDVQATLQNSRLVHKLFNEILPRYNEVKSGYTKLTAVGARKGDGAVMVKLALTKKAAKVEAKKEDKKETKVKSKAATPKLTVPKKETVNVAKVVAPRTGRRGDR